MTFGAAKTEARRILLLRDRDALCDWARVARGPFRALVSLTYDADELVRWRAIEAAGWVAVTHAETGLNKLRDTLRRLLWLMNDESGGLGWHAPEAIGEILVGAPTLIGEYIDVIPSYLKEEPFERGMHFAVSRLATVHGTQVPGSTATLNESLASADPHIRYYAAETLLTTGDNSQSQIIDRLRSDTSPIRIYDFATGQIRSSTVGDELQTSIP